MAIQNKFGVSGEAQGKDQLWANFKVPITEAAGEQIFRVKRKIKPRWMTDDILDLWKKGGK